jgi:fibronectin-binding autotransporter adhesin
LGNETNSYTGITRVNGGVLSVSKMADYGTDSSIGKGTAGTAINFDNSAALVYTGSGDDTDRLIQGNRDGVILNNGTGALNFTATGNFNVQTSQSLFRGFTFGGTHGGTISGALQNNTGSAAALSVAKIGTGTWTLGGTNTYTGNTDVNAGTLRLQSGASTITQTLGALRNQSAEGTLNSNKSGAGNLTTTFSSYTRAAGATGNIVSTGGTNGSDNSLLRRLRFRRAQCDRWLRARLELCHDRRRYQHRGCGHGHRFETRQTRHDFVFWRWREPTLPESCRERDQLDQHFR